jgi:hypothetical protein
MTTYDLTAARKKKIRENQDALWERQANQKAAAAARYSAKRSHPVCASCHSTLIQLEHGYELWDYTLAKWVHWGSTVIKCTTCNSTNASPQWVDGPDYLIIKKKEDEDEYAPIPTPI